VGLPCILLHRNAGKSTYFSGVFRAGGFDPPGRAIYPRTRGESAMKKFIILYMAPSTQIEQMMKNATPEQQSKGMDAWMKWMNANKGSLVDGGAPLGKTKRVDAKGTTDTKNEVCGYSIVQADTHDAAGRLFGKDHPHLQMPGAWIEIVEIRQIPGM
jgi:hypothetical protein